MPKIQKYLGTYTGPRGQWVKVLKYEGIGPIKQKTFSGVASWSTFPGSFLLSTLESWQHDPEVTFRPLSSFEKLLYT